jgi:DNA-binding transcriptional ArsR family regulator
MTTEITEAATGLAVGELQHFKAAFFKALAHPVRIRLLEELSRGEHSVQELQEALGLDQPLVSQQRGVLRTKQVVVGRKEGLTVRYTHRDPLVAALLQTAREIVNNQLSGHRAMLKALQREHRRARPERA